MSVQQPSEIELSDAIRPITRGDEEALMALLAKSGLFQPHELDEVGGMLDAYFQGDLGNDHFWIVLDDGGPAGVAYYAPEPMTEGVWNLYLIAVHPNRQGSGLGALLLRHVEQTLTSRGERLLLVETSGLESFELTRLFYRKNGFEEEARIRDFYKEGDDKIVFRKAIAHK